MTTCQPCGCRRRHGPNRIHETGECLQPWRIARRAQHPRRPGDRVRDEQRRRAADWDWPPEIIERIMARRALEQKYERALVSAATEV